MVSATDVVARGINSGCAVFLKAALRIRKQVQKVGQKSQTFDLQDSSQRVFRLASSTGLLTYKKLQE
jgi:hypothetical protein